MSDFVPDPDHARYKRCRWCGQRATADAPEPIRHNCRPCVHRGDVVRTQRCPGCAGNVRVKVFACAIHGACQVAAKLKGLRACEWCGDRES